MGEIRFVGAGKYPRGDDAFRDEVFNLVKDIGANAVGGVIVGAIINTTTQHLTIKPESERLDGAYDPDETDPQAATFPVSPAGKPGYATATPVGVSRTASDGRGKWYAGKSDDPRTARDDRFDPAPSSWGDVKGGGSGAHLFFTPGGRSDRSCARGHGTCAEMDDEVLLHEMVHALRHMQGVSNPVPTTGRYKNEEEFLAVVVTNVYISKKKGNKLLRPDYEQVGPLQPPWNTSDGFLKDAENKRILEHYSTAWQPIFGQLGDVETAFNPFRPFKTKRKP